MKKAVNQWCFPGDWSWERIFALCERTGFEAIELGIDYPPFARAMSAEPRGGLIGDIAKSVGSGCRRAAALRLDSPASEVASVRARAHAHGIRFASLTAIAQFHYALTQTDDTLWRTGIDITRRLLDLAGALEAPSVLVVPGLITEDIRYDVGLARLREALGQLTEHAESAGVTLALENVWGKILYSPLEMRDFVDSFASERVGVHFDVGNVLQYGYPHHWIRILGRRIRAVHLKDYRVDIDNIRGFTQLFLGDVPWTAVMEALREIGYDGYLIAEVPPYPFAPEEGIRDTARKMDLLLAGRRDS